MGEIPTLFSVIKKRGNNMIESDLIFNLQDFRTLITSKAKVGTYYRLYDEFYFEERRKYNKIFR